MSTQQTAVTQFIEATNGTKYAYRWLGPSTGVPLIMNIHFRGSMDWWDPAFVNPLAQARPIIIFDNAGVGESSGRIPNTFAKWADNMVALVVALKIPKVDVLGFSMGGFVAQMAALNYPNLVRKVILAGTVASKNADSPPTEWDLVGRFMAAKTEGDVEAAWAESFFTHNEIGTAAFQAYWARLSERNGKAPAALDQARTKDQGAVWADWTTGDADIFVPTASSFDLARKILFSHFHVYPNAGHGFYGQHGATFASHVNTFLDSGEQVLLGKKIVAKM
ncbi:hypothetical protein MMC17_009958 [Xylographa soralifera]|nr:hypothetical protein [Xylographa soralifera]